MKAALIISLMIAIGAVDLWAQAAGAGMACFIAALSDFSEFERGFEHE